MTIRPAIADDLPEIRRIVRAAYLPYMLRMGRAPAPMLDDYAARMTIASLHVLDGAEGRLAGIIVLLPREDHLLLDNIAVDPACQAQGVGRRLMAFAEVEARRLGLPEIRLYTNALMTENLALYPRLGYRQTDRRMEQGYDRVYFAKSVD